MRSLLLLKVAFVCLYCWNGVQSFPLLPKTSSLSFGVVKKVFDKIDSFQTGSGGDLKVLAEKMANVITFSNNTDVYESSSEASFDEMQAAVSRFQDVLHSYAFLSSYEIVNANSTENRIQRVSAGLECLDPTYQNTHIMIANYVSFQTTKIEELGKYIMKCSAGDARRNGCNAVVSNQERMKNESQSTIQLVNEYFKMIQDTDVLEKIQSDAKRHRKIHGNVDFTPPVEQEFLGNIPSSTLVFKLLLLFGATSFVTPLICFWTGTIKNADTFCEKFVVSITFKEFFIIMELVKRVRG
ncbi:unnamed protein product [Kluyveromyces dobzhanskii CBS 2104]|uniref:WGS project CCBQ000000000 data, contig 00272 n=1 Tax=Kluyveromyces dobzhanskii CBS 2104 TaxID=1427455 RepID=A0A0A8LB33_9SACH|nr:unnamed protein product [Kluyveromyces dobzhanskii CBS 2104]